MTQEIWKSVVGFEGMYEISNMGNVRGVERKGASTWGGIRMFPSKPLPGRLDKYGYRRVQLSRNSKKKEFLVHRLVLMAFVSNPDNKPVGNHKNGIKIDNRLENLEWNTIQENAIHAIENGLMKFDAVKRPVKKLYAGGGEKVWPSILDAAAEFKYSRQQIPHMITGRRKTRDGSKWEYVT